MRNGGRDGHAGHIQVKDDHKKQVQADIQETREDHHHQGEPGVLYGPQDSGAEIIDHKRGDSEKIDPQV